MKQTKKKINKNKKNKTRKKHNKKTNCRKNGGTILGCIVDSFFQVIIRYKMDMLQKQSKKTKLIIMTKYMKY